MKRSQLIIAFILLSQLLNAQVRPIGNEEPDSLPYIVLDTMPEYPGGNAALYSYIYKTISYPPIQRCEISGTTFIEFIVERNGSVSGINILKKFDTYLDSEAVKAIRSTTWKPGIKNGKAVRTKRHLPVRFTIR